MSFEDNLKKVKMNLISVQLFKTKELDLKINFYQSYFLRFKFLTLTLNT